MKLLLVGSSGLVGGHVLNYALGDSRIEKIIAPVRTVTISHPKLETPTVDFSQLPSHADWWKVDAVICTLGTTIKKAGSQKAFEQVDHDYPLHVAELAKKHGAQTFVIVTAMGANPNSLFFYNRVKGKVEQDLQKLNFRSLTIARPGLIGGDRKENRLIESVANKFLKTLSPALPKVFRINPAEKIATQLLMAAIKSVPGCHQITSDQMI